MLGKDNKLGLCALISICIGSMIGAGLFDLPQNSAVKAGIVALFVAWTITFLGMISLASVFRNLSTRCSHLDTGIYAYAKEGLGDYFGFSSAWGYWISVWAGNIGYVIMVCAALSIFFPIFGDGTTWASLLLSSIIIWSVAFLCLRGVQSAALINIVLTGIKIVPIIIFIGAIIYSFNTDTFVTNLSIDHKFGSISEQVKNMMLVTVWIFIGIEGANVLSGRARNRQDIGKATIISFLVMFLILFAISILPFGILKHSSLAALANPSAGSLFAKIVGAWGNKFMNIALIVSILGAFLSWVLIAAEVPFVAGVKDDLFPKVFTIKNKHNFPVGALIITTICEQLYLVFAHFCEVGYLATVMLAVAMILPPYLFSALYAWLLTKTGKTYEFETTKKRKIDLIISTIAVIYGFWLLYTARKYIFLSSMLYLIGSLVFIIHRKLKGQNIFTPIGWVLFLVIIILSIFSVAGLIMGKISF